MKNKSNLSSNRSFGIVFFIVFVLIGLYPALHGENLRYWAIIISLIFLVLGLIRSSLLTPLNIYWSKFGILLGFIVSPFIMAIIFFLVVTPIGLFMRLLGKDLINLKKHSLKSYWIEKKYYKSTMKDQF